MKYQAFHFGSVGGWWGGCLVGVGQVAGGVGGDMGGGWGCWVGCWVLWGFAVRVGGGGVGGKR